MFSDGPMFLGGGPAARSARRARLGCALACACLTPGGLAAEPWPAAPAEAAPLYAPAAEPAETRLEVSFAGAQSLGMVAGGKRATTFRIGGDGVVVAHGGDFVRLRGGPVVPQTVVISCRPAELSSDRGCNAYQGVLVTVSGRGAADWPGEIRNFRIAGPVDGARLADSRVGAASSSFHLVCRAGPCGKDETISFNLEFEIELRPGPMTGSANADFGYTVEAEWR